MGEIGRGAEAVVFLEKGQVTKRRQKKSYRLDAIDKELRRRRTKGEAGILEALGKRGIPVPQFIKKGDDEVVMSHVAGTQMKEILDGDAALAEAVGKVVGSVHAADIVHGDLTTSNMILGKDRKAYLIDFGLSYHSRKAEDKAVDLHLFLQALESRHHRVKEEAWRRFVKGYREYPHADKVLRRLEAVEKRGRHKTKRGQA